MPRITKAIASDLIQYAKSLTITANFWDPNARSAFEFARQMRSPRLKKINPGFECNFNEISTTDAASLVAEYLDGSKWSCTTAGKSAMDLRGEFYSRAADAEDNLDGPLDTGAASSKGKGGAADKGKGGKK
jgi:hypothetical protein